MIDILIPTYNRSPHLIKNIILLNRLIKKESLQGNFRLLISDNCSSDNTLNELERIKNEVDIEFFVYKQDKNLGLERNAIFLLLQADSDFIMYIGDDDYLPGGYLTYVIRKMKKDEHISAVIPGFSSLYSNGAIKPSRIEKFEEKKFPSGFKTACRLSCLGHQLSGILLRRRGIAERYLANNQLRNLYPFIFFLAYNNLRGTTYYTPKFRVLVSQDNKKDWGYDASGLLAEIFRNYKILYPNAPLKRLLLALSIMIKQGWRLRIGKNPKLAIKAFLHLMKSEEVDFLIRCSLIWLFPYVYVKNIFLFFKKKTI